MFAQANWDPGAIELELLSAKHSTVAGSNILPFADGDSETDNLELPDGRNVQISKCPNGHGKIKSPLCCGQDMSCSIG